MSAKLTKPQLNVLADCVSRHKNQGMSFACVGTYKPVLALLRAGLVEISKTNASDRIKVKPTSAGIELIEGIAP